MEQEAKKEHLISKLAGFSSVISMGAYSFPSPFRVEPLPTASSFAERWRGVHAVFAGPSWFQRERERRLSCCKFKQG